MRLHGRQALTPLHTGASPRAESARSRCMRWAICSSCCQRLLGLLIVALLVNTIPTSALQASGFEGVAALDIACRKTSAEPALALFRASRDAGENTVFQPVQGS